MKTKNLVFTGLLSTFLFSGCVHTVGQYTPDIIIPKDKIIQKVSMENYNNNVVIQNRAGGVFCSLDSMITLPDNQPINLYISDALKSELVFNGLYDKDSFQKIYITLEDFESGSDFGFSYWKFEITVKTQRGYGYKVYSIYKHDGLPNADESCIDHTSHFVPAVKQLVNEIVKDPSFHNLFVN
ncbi:MAG: hypothetical protein U9Q33_05980 [Campylobacterota bacterium]|nr:hypothetical protein [Campylobacterota bacterium]